MTDSFCMRKYFVIIPAFCAVLGIAATSIVSCGKGNDSDKEFVSLENSIIINGIKMESDEPLSEDDDGSIILDNTFDHGLKGQVAAAADKGNHKDTVQSKGTILEGLRKQDRRWHLTGYRIRKSDNLWSIARRFGVDHRLIIGLNDINNPDRLMCNRIIQVPTKRGVFHRVGRGETLTSIARKYNVSIEVIRKQNSLKGSVIMAKARLFIPDAVMKEPALMIAKREDTPPRIVPLKVTGKISLQWPLRGRITSSFGNRKDPFLGKRSFHCGVDISVNTGTPVKAAMDGKVIYSGWKDGYGNMVILRHKGGYITVYAHNSKNTSNVDDIIGRGQVIALSGNTGATTGAHLHFELRKYLTPLNPMRFFRK